MRTIETTVYQYDELCAQAQSKARDWYREASAGDDFYTEHVTEEFHEVLKACGWNVDSQRGISWSGFWSQGDGAAFGGEWRAEDCKPDAWLADRPATYTFDGVQHTCKSNKRWHDAIADIVALAAKYPGSSGSVELSRRGNNILYGGFSFAEDHAEEEHELDNDAAAYELVDTARSLADAFYRSLEAEYEHANSDETVAENIRANEYEFTIGGEPA